ncbi:MAG: hypothetical protein QM718_15685 [Steroidobacteraceae bacterium]
MHSPISRPVSESAPKHTERRRLGPTLAAAYCLLLAPAWAQQAPAPPSLDDSHDADNVAILNVDGQPVYWPEVRFWIAYIGKYYLRTHNIDKISDWSVTQNGLPLREFFLTTAIDYARKDRAIESKARELGLDISAEEQQRLVQERQREIQIYGGESEYRRIVESMYGSEEVFEFLKKMDLLGNAVFERVYGTRGERCDDACVSGYVQQQKLMLVRYVFLPGIDTEQKPLALRQRTANQQRLTTMLQRLKASKEPVTLFDALATDGGNQILGPQARGQSFASAYAKLQPDQYSGVVTTTEGDYLILRLPVVADMPVGDTGRSLRYWTAYQSLFKPDVSAWIASQKVELLPAYAQIDVAAQFSAAGPTQ